MQLIKDFSDIARIVSFLNDDYQQKLLSEINLLVIKFMDEQTKSSKPLQVHQQNLANNNDDSAKPQPVMNQNLGVKEVQTKPEISNEGINNLRNSFSKGNASNLPPPPLANPNAQAPHLMTRSIVSGGFNLKANFSTAKAPQNKKPTISVLDALGYITPSLTDVGENLLKNPNTSSDIYQFLKEINGQSSLKEIYYSLYPNSNLWVKFIDKIYPMYHERALNLPKSKNYPSDVELSIKFGEMVVAMGLIDEATLEKSLEYQKNPPATQTPVAAVQSGPSWMEKVKSATGQAENSPGASGKKKIGEVMIEMKLITKDELNNILTLQKWMKNIIEHS